MLALWALGGAQATSIFDTWYLAIQDRAIAGTLNFFETIYKEIYLNLLSSGRWKLYLRGLGITLEVSFFSAIVGVVLGTLLAMLRLPKSRNPVLVALNKLSGAYIAIMRGTPMVLQVMIIYFGVFGSTNISKVIVGVIACGLNSAAYVAEIVRGAVLSVDKGQTEAGRSLGLSNRQTMLRIVFPQALKISLPMLCNEFIVLIKETSILSFIALMELTKAGDYVRSKTYSAFTPYIITGVIYLIVTGVLTKLLSKLERRLRQGDNR